MERAVGHELGDEEGLAGRHNLATVAHDVPANARPHFISAGFGTTHVCKITNVKPREAIVRNLWLSTLMIAASSSWT
jgi:hypothetical protein